MIYQKVALGDGKQGNNPWLLEMPDPITRVSWDNYAIISPRLAKEYGINLSDRWEADKYEIYPEKPVIKVKVGNKEIALPVIVIPGMQNEHHRYRSRLRKSERNRQIGS